MLIEKRTTNCYKNEKCCGARLYATEQLFQTGVARVVIDSSIAGFLVS